MSNDSISLIIAQMLYSLNRMKQRGQLVIMLATHDFIMPCMFMCTYSPPANSLTWTVCSFHHNNYGDDFTEVECMWKAARMNRSSLVHQSCATTSHTRNLVAKNMKPGTEMHKHFCKCAHGKSVCSVLILQTYI